ncbi:uncharacterized protein LY79DRAFT_13024 [Colletotrichum navitas]|uniref:Uncharacterized protein n=1 Tax=Colletotrichum navitas TaxID=681940 RepID=A0AAD8VD72_9PEZI|nr:uncharacterized protein LY79DRAFT_13024 [Colletotrichum navitas]KAK1600275.1 hypothetical protein LY79DRAFT_13024 [Colletotrichum navitas]
MASGGGSDPSLDCQSPTSKLDEQGRERDSGSSSGVDTGDAKLELPVGGSPTKIDGNEGYDCESREERNLGDGDRSLHPLRSSIVLLVRNVGRLNEPGALHSRGQMRPGILTGMLKSKRAVLDLLRKPIDNSGSRGVLKFRCPAGVSPVGNPSQEWLNEILLFIISRGPCWKLDDFRQKRPRNGNCRMTGLTELSAKTWAMGVSRGRVN